MIDMALLQDQLRLAATASAFDLTRPADRERSTRELTSLFYDLQAAVTPTCFIEIGAHDARFSKDMATRHPGTKVVAFEGNPNNHAHFASTFDYAAHGVDYRHALVSDIDGVAEMMLQVRWNGQPFPLIKGSDSLLKRNREDVEYETREVASTRLDTAFADRGATGGLFTLWIDVEGATQQVFAGAVDTLSNTASIFIEVEEHPYWENQWLFDDVQAHLAKAGFLALARDFEFEHQFNVVFVHRALWQVATVRGALNAYLSRIGRP
ncbi:FkbM family methyltransferase [Caulobacter sp. S45]|uniref:FkbM family methyltransferase n=1 Tax=Caulobacter sp. S45 TaxID=1641861 RepID=UPI00131E35A0|nr:FkbM family methyltransferase [Caulobacter sp. S45]